MNVFVNVFFTLLLNVQVSGWEIFLATRFQWMYVEAAGAEVQIPKFDKKIQSMEGEEITLTGFYLPVTTSNRKIVLSRFPYASCFFCGGSSGLESVVEVYFAEEQSLFKVDDLVTVKGTLLLNDGVDGRLVFIVHNAEVVDRGD